MSKFKVGDTVQGPEPFGEGMIEGFVADGVVFLRSNSGQTGIATEEELTLLPHHCENCLGIDVSSCLFNPDKVQWTTLAELRFGAIFETWDGRRGCKCFNPDWMLSSYTNLDNGKMVVAKDAKNLKVREIRIP